MPPLDADARCRTAVDDDATGSRARELQRTLWDGGFAGICYPGSTAGRADARRTRRLHRGVAAGYEMPLRRSTCRRSRSWAPTLLDFGTEEQKATPPAGHPARRRAVGAVPVRAHAAAPTWPAPSPGPTRDGDVFVLNGSKIWSSGAYVRDYALCLARTDWDVPKHRGLTMFIVHDPPARHHGRADQAGQRRRRVLPGVLRRRPDARRRTWSARSTTAGPWPPGCCSTSATPSAARRPTSAASRWGPDGPPPGADGGGARARPSVVRVTRLPPARRRGARRGPGERPAPSTRVVQGIGHGHSLSPASGSILKLAAATSGHAPHREPRCRSRAMQRRRGPRTGPSPPGTSARARCSARRLLGGGSNEMQRNIISERVLGMPREHAADRDIPFRDVPHSGRD